MGTLDDITKLLVFTIEFVLKKLLIYTLLTIIKKKYIIYNE